MITFKVTDVTQQRKGYREPEVSSLKASLETLVGNAGEAYNANHGHGHLGGDFVRIDHNPFVSTVYTCA